jgi:hypothetical protein
VIHACDWKEEGDGDRTAGQDGERIRTSARELMLHVDRRVLGEIAHLIHRSVVVDRASAESSSRRSLVDNNSVPSMLTGAERHPLPFCQA